MNELNSPPSVSYARIDLQLKSIFQFLPFHFIPATVSGYIGYIALKYLPPTIWWSWMVYPFVILVIGYTFLLLIVLMVGISYNFVPALEPGKRYKTYSKEWVSWGVKAELYKVVADYDILYNYILKIFSLRWLFFKLIGLKLPSTSMIATDVRIYEPHYLEVGENILLPVYSIFSGHLITGNTMIMGKIKIGDNCRLGAQSGYSPGVTIAKEVTIGFGVQLGPFVSVGEKTMIDSGTKVADQVTIGKNCYIGKDCVIDRRVTIGDNITIPPFTRIKAKRKILRNEDIFQLDIGERRVAARTAGERRKKR